MAMPRMLIGMSPPHILELWKLKVFMFPLKSP